MEIDIQREILKQFGARRDMKIWRANTGAGVGMSFIQQAKKLGYIPDNIPITRYGVPGQADIQGILSPNGRHVSIEVKYSTKQSEDQARWQRMVESMGGLYILAHSVKDINF